MDMEGKHRNITVDCNIYVCRIYCADPPQGRGQENDNNTRRIELDST